MTGFNHVMTGAVIAATVKQPVLVLPLSFLSHFVLDSLPHYGVDYHNRHLYRSFKRVVGTDLVVVPLALILVPFLLQSWLVFFAMVLAVAPDSIWFIKYYLDQKRGQHFQIPKDPFSRFHKWIQWGERPWGWWIELAWAATAVSLLIMTA